MQLATATPALVFILTIHTLVSCLLSRSGHRIWKERRRKYQNALIAFTWQKILVSKTAVFSDKRPLACLEKQVLQRTCVFCMISCPSSKGFYGSICSKLKGEMFSVERDVLSREPLMICSLPVSDRSGKETNWEMDGRQPRCPLHCSIPQEQLDTFTCPVAICS